MDARAKPARPTPAVVSTLHAMNIKCNEHSMQLCQHCSCVMDDDGGAGSGGGDAWR